MTTHIGLVSYYNAPGRILFTFFVFRNLCVGLFPYDFRTKRNVNITTTHCHNVMINVTFYVYLYIYIYTQNTYSMSKQRSADQLMYYLSSRVQFKN